MPADTQYAVAVELCYPEKIVKLALRRKTFKDAGSLLDYLDANEEELREQADNEAAAAAAAEEAKRVEDEQEEEENSAQVKNPTIKLSLREETELLYRRSVCLRCQRHKRTQVCLPCCHFALCDSCERSTDVCPFHGCNTIILHTVRTFMA